MRLGDVSVQHWAETKKYVDTLMVPAASLCLDERGRFGLYAEVASAVADRVEQRLAGRVMLAPLVLVEEKGCADLCAFVERLQGHLELRESLVLVAVGLTATGDLERRWKDLGVPSVVFSLTGEQVLAQAIHREALDHAIGMWGERLAEEVVHMWRQFQAS
ncbi:MAG: DUF2487 family protein [Alicyclobacillaceae bacterium]|nr:DUF2487 family protein [Alicyclobacillaceae bacterium]